MKLNETAYEQARKLIRAGMRYTFPYGDFRKVHRCGLLAAESRAGQYRYPDIEHAAHELHETMEARVKV